MHLFLLIEREPAGTRQLNGENPNVAILMGTAMTRPKCFEILQLNVLAFISLTRPIAFQRAIFFHPIPLIDR